MAKNSGKQTTFSAGDVSMFCAQMALILQSAIPLQDGIAAIRENLEEGKAKKIIEMMEQQVEGSTPFYQALRDSGAFPGYMVNMIEIGEKAGKLDDVMEALADYYDREDKLKKSVRSAVLYPFILVLMMSVVIAVLVAKVLPVFQQVFDQLGSQMSDFSTFVMNVGMGIGRYAFIAVLVVAVLLIALFIVSKTRKGSAALSRFSGSFLPTRKLSAKIASARFASVMSMMLSSGYSTDEALELIPKIITDVTMNKKINACRELVNNGTSFGEAIHQTHLFPGIYGRMVGVGMKTGSLDTVMKKLAGLYEEEVDHSIDTAVSVIEPVLVGILSVIIGAILLSVMLPLMGIMSSIG